MDKQDLIVSVICLAYNHGKFIDKTLRGFINQKTNFKFEVIVHDDASSDNTSEIIRKYQKEFPSIIKPIYQTENQYSKKVGIQKNYILPQLKGKYVAWCEADDYWTDSCKLQEQVDALENNKDCVACISTVERISFDENRLGVFFPVVEMNTGVLSAEDYMKYTLHSGFPWQLSGLLVRADTYIEYLINPPRYCAYFEAGDIPLFLFIGLKGDVYYINKVMSNYRTGNPNSWLGRANNDNVQKAKYFLKKADAYREFDLYTNQKYHTETDYMIRRSRFFAYAKLHDIKSMKSEDTREFYSELSFKQKFFQYVWHFFPFMERKNMK